MLSVINAECRHAECCKQALYAECHYAECYNAECHYAECRGTDERFCNVDTSSILDYTGPVFIKEAKECSFIRTNYKDVCEHPGGNTIKPFFSLLLMVCGKL